MRTDAGRTWAGLEVSNSCRWPQAAGERESSSTRSVGVTSLLIFSHLTITKAEKREWHIQLVFWTLEEFISCTGKQWTTSNRKRIHLSVCLTDGVVVVTATFRLQAASLHQAWWRLAACSRNVAVTTTTPSVRQTDKCILYPFHGYEYLSPQLPTAYNRMPIKILFSASFVESALPKSKKTKRDVYVFKMSNTLPPI